MCSSSATMEKLDPNEESLALRYPFFSELTVGVFKVASHTATRNSCTKSNDGLTRCFSATVIRATDKIAVYGGCLAVGGARWLLTDVKETNAGSQFWCSKSEMWSNLSSMRVETHERKKAVQEFFGGCTDHSNAARTFRNSSGSANIYIGEIQAVSSRPAPPTISAPQTLSSRQNPQEILQPILEHPTRSRANCIWHRRTLKSCTNYPLRRHSHTFTAVSSTTCILFGGKGPHGCLNDTWKYANGEWSPITYDPEAVFPSARYQQQAVYWRPVRSANPDSAAAVEQKQFTGEYLIIYGGFGADRKKLNDLWIFDVREEKWMKRNIQVSCDGENPLITIWRDSLYLISFSREYSGTLSAASGSRLSEKEKESTKPTLRLVKLDLHTDDSQVVWRAKDSWNLMDSSRWSLYQGILVGCQWFFISKSATGIDDTGCLYDLVTGAWRQVRLAVPPERNRDYELRFAGVDNSTGDIMAVNEKLDIIVFRSSIFRYAVEWDRRYLLHWILWLAKTETWISAPVSVENEVEKNEAPSLVPTCYECKTLPHAWQKFFFNMIPDAIAVIFSFL